MSYNYKLDYKLSKAIFISMIFFLCSCNTAGYKKFYTPFFTKNTLKKMKESSNFTFLKKGEKPRVFTTENYSEAIRQFKKKSYILIGYSSFNGSIENKGHGLNQAKSVRALIVLFASPEHTNTESSTGSFALPNTNYHSGTVSTSNGSETYSGTSTGSTTHVSTTHVYTNHTKRYDQGATYFIKDNRKFKVGVRVYNISREHKIRIGTTGVKVSLILENYPAYESNLLRGDVVTKIDGHVVKNTKHFFQLISNIRKNYSLWEVLRNNHTITPVEINLKNTTNELSLDQ